MKFWREMFRVLRFPGFGRARENFTSKFHVKNGVQNGKFHANFTLLGGGADSFLSSTPPRRLPSSKRNNTSTRVDGGQPYLIIEDTVNKVV